MSFYHHSILPVRYLDSPTEELENSKKELKEGESLEKGKGKFELRYCHDPKVLAFN